MLYKDKFFAVICLGSAATGLSLLPCSDIWRAVLGGVCLLTEASWIYECWPKRSLLEHLSLIGPLSLCVVVLALLVYLAIYLCKRDGDYAWCTADILSLSLALPILVALCPLHMSSSYVYDMVLMKADGLWGWQPALVIISLLRSHENWMPFLAFFYLYLPLWLLLSQVIAYGREYLDRTIPIMRSPGIPVFTFIAAVVVSVLCYSYLPAVGPLAYFPGQVFEGGSWMSQGGAGLAMVPYSGCAPCDSMPCLPFIWMLCAYSSTYNLRPRYQMLWFLLTLFALISAFAVHGHWATDVLVSVPLAVFCVGLMSYRMPAAWRWGLTVGSGLGGLALVLALKYWAAQCAAYPIVYCSVALFIDAASIAGLQYALNRVRSIELSRIAGSRLVSKLARNYNLKRIGVLSRTMTRGQIR
ncbi:hypothetical protein IJT17_05930 [bacterium]|nr:hypothetical protein [bacterium]